MCDERILNKFPALLKAKLISGDIIFSSEVQFKYDDIVAYRYFRRDEGDNTPFGENEEDMQSYAQLNKKPVRGICSAEKEKCDNNPEYYATSLYRNKEELINNLHICNSIGEPKKCKHIAKGTVYSDGGPCLIATKDSHVSWWIFEGASFENFCEVGIKDE